VFFTKFYRMKKIIIFFIALRVFAYSFSQKTENYKDLMPMPVQADTLKGILKIDENFTIGIPDENPRIKTAATKFLRRLSDRTGIFLKKGFPEIIGDTIYTVEVKYDKKSQLKLKEDESYSIEIKNYKILLAAKTDLGIIHAFETLLQLLENTPEFYYFHNIKIKDYPRFAWRGLLIDVSRHFEPVNVIKRNLDAMCVAKLNVFHWHLSDDQGFRVEIKKYPQLTNNASDGQFYTQEQIKDVIKYAADRGIMVMPEIDVPGHATAILTAFPEIGSVKDTIYTLQRNAGIFDPTLDPTNPKTYEILDGIFQELAKLFPFEYIHIGGDENRGKHWNRNIEIQKFMKKEGLKSNHELQTYFNLKLVKILRKYGKKMMGWEEIASKKLPKDAIIHSWMGKPGQSLSKAIKQGYQAVLSNGFYIDLMLPAATHYQTRFVTAQYPLTKKQQEKILGGEATMWGELVTPLTIDSRIWPRTLAIGERFWSSKDVRDIRSMYRRMFKQSYHLEELGITHIRNVDVILRNITENQDITYLKKLVRIYEPLKYYTRNKGGAEYQSYSPFTLFADACSADAPDAVQFNLLVDQYLKTKKDQFLHSILSDYLLIWKDYYAGFSSQNLKINPKLKKIYVLSKNFSQMSDILYKLLSSQKADKKLLKKFETELKKMNEISSKTDVEPGVKHSFIQLVEYWKISKE